MAVRHYHAHSRQIHTLTISDGLGCMAGLNSWTPLSLFSCRGGQKAERSGRRTTHHSPFLDAALVVDRPPRLYLPLPVVAAGTGDCGLVGRLLEDLFVVRVEGFAVAGGAPCVVGCGVCGAWERVAVLVCGDGGRCHGAGCGLSGSTDIEE